MNIKLFSQLSVDEQLGALREWLFPENQQRVSEDFLINGRSLWMIMFDLQAWNCVAELLKFKDADVLLNFKDENGRGWCHYCIYQAAPDYLSIEGLGELDATWNAVDAFGHTPMEAHPSVSLAQQMARRWWSEHLGLSPDSKTSYFQQLAQRISDKDWSHAPLRRVWLFWGRKPPSQNIE